MNERLIDRIGRGTRRVALLQIASQVVSVATLTILFRRLGAEPFGLIGMLLPLLQLARMLGAFGIHVAVVQDGDTSAAVRSAAFWLNQATGLSAGVGFAAGGVVWSWITGVPQLVPIALVLSITMPLGALSNVHAAMWEKELRVAPLAAVRLAAQIAGAGAAVILACRGAGVWALVAQQLVDWITLAALLWCYTGWRPTWVGLAATRRFASFGGWFTGANILFYFGQNVDKLVLAWWIGRTSAGRTVLGFYTQSFNLVNRPVLGVTAPLYGILLPALVRVRRQLPMASRLVGKFFRWASWVLVPSAFGLVLVADDLMEVLGGPAWRPAGRLLAVMAPLVAVLGISNLCGGVLAAFGRARSLFLAALLQAGATSLVAAGTALAGHLAFFDEAGSAYAMACAMSLLQVLQVAPLYWILSLRTVRLGAKTILLPLGWNVAAAALMAVVVAVVQRQGVPHATPLVRLVVASATGAVAYGLLMLPHIGPAVRAAWRGERPTIPAADHADSDD